MSTTSYIMFMNDCAYKLAVRNYLVNYLANLGLPSKKISKNDVYDRKTYKRNIWMNAKIKFKAEDKESVKIYHRKVFNVPLKKLRRKNIILPTGQTLPIPRIVHNMCQIILENVKTEGIFHKVGSRTEQEKLMAKIEETGCIENGEWDAIDIACILKCFLRELPQPLIPYSYHDLFLGCCNLDDKEELILRATLLLPTENLNLLTYLMQFFEELSNFASYNKMCPYNLSICIAPTIMPLCKLSNIALYTTYQITALWIVNASEVGVIRDELQQNVLNDTRVGDKKTNPITILLNECKKMLYIIGC